MSYPLYVLKQGVAPSPLFKSHWALFILIQGDSAQGNALGTYIHVTGSAYAGFTFEAKRNWNQATDDQTFRFILIGQVPETSIVLQPLITDYMIDDAARSPLEIALLTEPAPGKSLKVSAFDLWLQVPQLGLTDIIECKWDWFPNAEGLSVVDPPGPSTCCCARSCWTLRRRGPGIGWIQSVI